jgi:hypothetical protein
LTLNEPLPSAPAPVTAALSVGASLVPTMVTVTVAICESPSASVTL